MPAPQELADRALELARSAIEELRELAGPMPDGGDARTDELFQAGMLLRPDEQGDGKTTLSDDSRRGSARDLLFAAFSVRRSAREDESSRGRPRDRAAPGWQALERKDFQAAAGVAGSLIKEAVSTPEEDRDWNYGNLLHEGHIMLGAVRLVEGDLPAAEAELRAAGQTPGSPQLNSFGPDLSLAWALLRRERDEAVLDYLHGIARFWSPDWRPAPTKALAVVLPPQS